MILAAGLGTRLLPYTRLRPKPLFPVLGEPLLKRIIGQLRAAGLGPIVVNAHHLAGQIAACLADEPDLILQREDTELGTGGGLRLALPHFQGRPVLVTNGDIFHDIDYRQVLAGHQASGCPLTMVMHDLPRFNSVPVAGGRVLGLPAGGRPAEVPPGARRLAFTGIHVVEPALLADIPSGSFHSILDRYQGHLDEGGQIHALTVRDHFWRDIGTPRDYLELHRHLLLADGAAPSFRLAPGVRLGREVTLDDWGYVGAGAVIGDRARLARVVVWEGAEIPAGQALADCLVTG